MGFKRVVWGLFFLLAVPSWAIEPCARILLPSLDDTLTPLDSPGAMMVRGSWRSLLEDSERALLYYKRYGWAYTNGVREALEDEDYTQTEEEFQATADRHGRVQMNSEIFETLPKNKGTEGLQFLLRYFGGKFEHSEQSMEALRTCMTHQVYLARYTKALLEHAPLDIPWQDPSFMLRWNEAREIARTQIPDLPIHIFAKSMPAILTESFKAASDLIASPSNPERKIYGLPGVMERFMRAYLDLNTMPGFTTHVLWVDYVLASEKMVATLNAP